jgi:F-type H+-transporting ATPase subunit b
MPQLDPTWFASQLFWLVITFSLLYVVLSRFMLPPLQAIIARRQETLDHDVNQAQTMKSQAELARQEYDRLLAETRAKAQQLLADAQASHKAKAERAAQEMDKEIERKLTDATQRIEAKKQELKDALMPTTAELTSIIVEKLTRRAPSSEQVSRILDAISKGRS